MPKAARPTLWSYIVLTCAKYCMIMCVRVTHAF